MGLLRRLFGSKKTSSTTSSPPSKRRWSFARSSSPSSQSNKREGSASVYEDSLDANKHAIAVAAATAAVAEAALAAAQAAAEVVRLTTAKGGSVQVANSAPRRWLKELAAVKIQSAFRGYLARRALRALKALVKLQALVRGHIVRKQTADMLRRMQTLVRLQARARATRSLSQFSDSWQSCSSSNYSRHVAPSSPHKDHLYRNYSSKYDRPSILKRCGSNANFREMVDGDGAKFGSLWLERWMEESLQNDHGSKPTRNRHADDERNDKILEVDTWRPRMKFQQNSRTFNLPRRVLAPDDACQSFMSFDSPSKLSTKGAPSVPSVEALSFNSLKLSHGKEEAVYKTAENSPRALSVSSRPGSSSGRRAPFTPTRSETSWGYLNGYEGFPNYMCNTESSRAKVRSQSAPRQRLEFDKYGLSEGSLQSLYEGDTISERSFPRHNDYIHKAYTASGRLSRIGSSNLR